MRTMLPDRLIYSSFVLVNERSNVDSLLLEPVETCSDERCGQWRTEASFLGEFD